MVFNPSGSKSRRSSKKNPAPDVSENGKGAGATGSGAGAKSRQATGPNTTTKWYWDTKEVRRECAKERNAIERNCKPESEDVKKKRLDSQKGGISGLLSKITPPKGVAEKNPGAAWIGDHCDFLMVKSNNPKEMFDQLQGIPEKMAENLGKKALEEGIEKAKDKVAKAIEKKVAEIMLKKGAQKVAARAASLLTGPFAIVINIGMTAYDIYDAKATYDDVVKQFESDFKTIKQSIDQLADVNKQIDDVKKILNGETYRNQDGSLSPEKVVADAMSAAAELNPCIRARRCKLVPYSETTKAAGKNTGNGCCPGQTGHHILPSAMFEGCPSYDKNAAPTLCVEGTSNWGGSHKRVHDKMLLALGGLKGKNGNPIPEGAQITKDQAIKAGGQAVQNAFPSPGCDPKCIEAQLREFYKKVNCTPKNKSGASGGAGKSETGRGGR